MSVEHCSQPEFYRSHLFREHERRTLAVVALTLVMMVAEIISGWWFGSMALLADGFHMATHAGALGISAFAYSYARRHAHDARYSFGTGKVSDLAGFTSAIILSLIAIYVIYEASARLISPVSIAYGEAIVVAFLGLGVNVVSAFILHGAHDHDYSHGHDHEDHAHHHDNNFRSAYVHVIADAVTSILALFALFCGWAFGWRWMDPVMGIIGSFVILSWARSLVRDTSGVLLDRTPQTEVTDKIRNILAGQGVEIADLHIWRVGPGAHAVIIALRTKQSITADQVRLWLQPLDLAHVTVEINQSL